MWFRGRKFHMTTLYTKNGDSSGVFQKLSCDSLVGETFVLAVWYILAIITIIMFLFGFVNALTTPPHSNITQLPWHFIVPSGIIWRITRAHKAWSVPVNLEKGNFKMSANHLQHLDKNLKDCYRYELDWALLPDNLRKVSIHLRPFRSSFFFTKISNECSLNSNLCFVFFRCAVSLPKL